MNTVLRRVVPFLVALIVAIPAPLIFAQETKPPETKPAETKEKKPTAEEEKKPKVSEEMVVTARKREETVQDVPMSVAAPTESELRDRGAENIEDVAANVAERNLGFKLQRTCVSRLSHQAVRGG